MTTFLLVVVQAFAVVLIADFIAGLIHWVEDAYIRDDTPLVGGFIGRPNVIHHHHPRYMTRHSWLQSSWDLLFGSSIIILLAWWADLLSWHVWWFALVSTHANEVHKWSHRTRKENGRIISYMQDIRLLQTPRHHAVHHTNPKNVRYCPITNVLNPLLDQMYFWGRLERILAHTIGLHRRPDTSVPENGPPPLWLEEFRCSCSIPKVNSKEVTPLIRGMR